MQVRSTASDPVPVCSMTSLLQPVNIAAAAIIGKNIFFISEQQKVVVIFNARKQNIRLFRVYDDGGVDKEFSFPVDFYPEYFTIEHLEGSRYKLLASELGRDEYYTVDFDKRIVY